MKTSEEIKSMVKEKYSEIALQENKDQGSCCGTSCCSTDIAPMPDDYKNAKGYVPEADLGLGCGLPVEFAKIKTGDTVVDLGSGAGNDCFVARAETGESGKVIGIDMTDAMVRKARLNAEKLNYHNVEFRLGDVEDLPVSSGSADVVISNCVLNLVPDKSKAFAEIHRILKPGGHFSISDIVMEGSFPPGFIENAEMYAGCIAGAIQKESYINIIKSAGFRNITLQKEKLINIPDDILEQHLNAAEIKEYKSSLRGIYSITVYAEKPKDECCDKTTCCK